MRRLLILTLTLSAGCLAYSEDVPREIEDHVAAVARARSAPVAVAAADPATLPTCPIDLSGLWTLALSHNPSLREAAADIEAARGQLIEANKYPNPRITYSQEELGTQQNAAGSLVVQVSQEIVTGDKRRLDLAIATRGADQAFIALLGRKFEVLARVRRAYYNFVALANTVRVHDEVLATLRQAVELTRKQVEDAKSRPRTDLLRVQALLREAQINRANAQATLAAAWRQLAIEVGLANLPMPPQAGALPATPPRCEESAVEARLIAVNTELKRAASETQRARLEVDRAQAEAVPNVTVGSGFSRNFAENERGGVVSVETALPLWDHKKGRIHEAQARLAKAQVAERTAVARLRRETTEALERYQIARRQVEELSAEVLPLHVESLDLLRKGYQGGATQITFADVLSAEQATLTTRLTLVEARRNLWLAIADLEGLMQLDVDEKLPEAMPR
jgi:cobalt-zinc-cadmium efflux system outer membrane protein